MGKKAKPKTKNRHHDNTLRLRFRFAGPAHSAKSSVCQAVGVPSPNWRGLPGFYSEPARRPAPQAHTRRRAQAGSGVRTRGGGGPGSRRTGPCPPRATSGQVPGEQVADPRRRRLAAARGPQESSGGRGGPRAPPPPPQPPGTCATRPGTWAPARVETGPPASSLLCSEMPLAHGLEKKRKKSLTTLRNQMIGARIPARRRTVSFRGGGTGGGGEGDPDPVGPRAPKPTRGQPRLGGGRSRPRPHPPANRTLGGGWGVPWVGAPAARSTTLPQSARWRPPLPPGRPPGSCPTRGSCRPLPR